MTLRVREPLGFSAERRWVLDVIIGCWWGLSWTPVAENRTDVRIELVDHPDAGGVVVPDLFFGTQPWLDPASLAQDVSWWPVGVPGTPALEATDRLPALYARDGAERLVELLPGEARLQVDVVGAAFVLLSRYEEHVVRDRDGHDRFPAVASLAGRHGFLRLPLVDAYAELLWIACRALWPRLERSSSTYAVRLTHDVDDPLATQGRSLREQARQVAGDLARRRNAGLAARRLRAMAAARRGHHDPDPHNTFDFLMGTSERHGLRSAFYFLAHRDGSPGPSTCRLLDDAWVRQLVGHVGRRGHEVGFHAAFGTYRDAEALGTEFGRLLEVAREQGVHQGRWGGRQHYLQWAPETWPLWEGAGLDYDATLAYSEALGFRTGTSRPYPAFDVTSSRRLDLVEEPLQVMDVTLVREAGGLGPGAIEAACAIAAQCRRFGGTFGLLWHNDEVLRTVRERHHYAELIAAVTGP